MRSKPGGIFIMRYFITLEGCEGVGKSTALSFIESYLASHHVDFILTREPGGTAVGEAIRDILLHRDDETILPETELLLMFAARLQHIEHVIKPALNAGKTVISDRFTDSSFAYQGGGRKIAEEKLQTLADWVQGTLQPDLTLLLDAPVSLGLSRISERGGLDRIEQEKAAFFERVRAVYLARAKQFSKRFVIIDATQSVDNVQAQIAATLKKLKI